MKTLNSKLLFALALVLITTMLCPFIVNAKSLDDLSSNDNSANTTTIANSAVGDYLQGYNPVTEDNMQKASVLASPIANAIGTLTGFIMIVVMAWIFAQTAIDLAYISMPFLRPTLDGGQGQQQGGMGGMGMRGGMGMGMQGGMGQQGGGRCWVSDEAILAIQGANAGQQGGMGGMGGMGMGMQGGMGQQQQQQGGKTPIITYFGKRVVFYIFFAICSVVLLSSIFTDCGINLAALIEKIMTRINGSINDVQI